MYVPFQMEEMVDSEAEARIWVQRDYGDAFYAFRVLWDNEPLESIGKYHRQWETAVLMCGPQEQWVGEGAVDI